MRVLIAGGGTGGHVYPGIAIYRALDGLVDGLEVLFVGAKNGVEGTILKDLALPNVLLAGRGVRGSSLLSKLTNPFVLMAAIVSGMKVISAFKPDVVIGTGGYASVAIVAGAVVARRRRVLQEQNSVPGLANRVLSRFADLVLLSYEESRAWFGAGVKCEVVGNPLRIKTTPDRDAGLRFFDLSPDLQTVLIYGGSRGARAINDAAVSAISGILTKRDVQFVMLTGTNDFERVETLMKNHASRVRVLPFLEDIGHAYSVADVAVARAGASSVFELAAFGVPTIYVPYPYAADDHQKKNVEHLEKTGGAIVIDHQGLSGEALEAIILSLLDDDERRKEMAATVRGWARIDAAELAAKKVMEIAGASEARSGGSALIYAYLEQVLRRE
ncbi:MAG: undecaprenyldiphospho-muramoylpentapeptide beta-N-acetylglucosaminyltransferase [bacterium]|nr:undecaprenyldiphospho-muramoylpentapeptide beta-N-acetylglucosaminyltransferase [bacterium]